MASMTQEDILNFLDLLDLDEEVVDKRLKSLMVRTSHTMKNLSNSLHLLQYKLLINIQEDSDCGNDDEINFIAKLLPQLSRENIDYVCKIINIVLRLSPSALPSKAEHLLQQILSDLFATNEIAEQDLGEPILLKLKVCDSILDAALQNKDRVSLLFVETPLETILNLGNDKLKSHFLLNTVPRLFNAVLGYNILDRIWEYVRNLTDDQKHTALQALITLSEFYLPTADKDGNVRYQSAIILTKEFWQIILFGINNGDPSCKKIALYLSKRSIECLMNMKQNVTITSEKGMLIFQWDTSKEKEYKLVWDNYFILIESLDEKQANIVLPSLQLFDSVQSLGHSWLNTVYHVGLTHPNTQIKLKCIEYRMKTNLSNVSEAKALLEALNDINLYAKTMYINNITLNIEKLLHNDTSAPVSIFKAISLVNWSPVPFYYISNVITKRNNVKEALLSIDFVDTLSDIFKISCNNVLIRSKVHTDFLKLLTESCDVITSEQLAKIMSALRSDGEYDFANYGHILAMWVKKSNSDKKEEVRKFLSEKYYHLDVIIDTLDEEAQSTELIKVIINKLDIINNVINRQYCNKLECYNSAAYLIILYNYEAKGSKLKSVKDLIEVNFHTLARYILDLLVNEKVPSEDEIAFLDNNLLPIFEKGCQKQEIKQIIQNINNSSLTILKDQNSDMARKIFCMTLFKLSLKANQEQNIMLKDVINAATCTELNQSEPDRENRSRLLNKLFQTQCELIYLIILKNLNVTNIDHDMVNFIDDTIERGGYGCLQWILKIMRKILPKLCNDSINYDVKQFIDRTWKEIEELKSNYQYTTCIEEFINILLEILFNKSMCNNTIYGVINYYCKKIIEMGETSPKPLIILTRKISTLPMTKEVGAVYLLPEILLFTPVPRKDQRITNMATVDIISELPNREVHIREFDSPQHIAASALLNITDKEIFADILKTMMDKVDVLFKNKQRYHGNSHHHRVLLATLQHTLLILLIQPEVIDLKVVLWCVDMLGKIPHQPSVKICLEWIVALYFCLKELQLNEANIKLMQLKTVPQLSQFMIPYQVLNHRIQSGSFQMEEHTFLMEYLLSHTMGQQYTIRLHAQFLALQIDVSGIDIEYDDPSHRPNYDYILNLIEKNFKESEKEKNYVRLKEDFFVNKFDIIDSLTPKFIYHLLPAALGDDTNNLQIISLPKIDDCKEYIKNNNIVSEVTRSWNPKHDDEVTELCRLWSKDLKDIEDSQHVEEMGTIQKKYIPWRNMTDIDGLEGKKKTENTNGLIVVASLIDKLPNLGGLARTSEVFGVQTYVIDSLRHVQDRQFQSLSLSAERWIDIEEVRPGKPLKEYLMRKKSEGYSVVAAEQTSNSVPLQSFRFPKKTLLLLGHEKEGVPSDLLLLTDHFVEIPQQGFVRSLNVHVTAALFVWRYTEQHMLAK